MSFVILSKFSPYFAYSSFTEQLIYRYMENSLFMNVFLLIIIRIQHFECTVYMNFDSKMEKNSGLYKDNIDHHLPPRRTCSKSNPNLNSFSGSAQFNFCTEEDPKNCQISVLNTTSYCVNALFNAWSCPQMAAVKLHLKMSCFGQQIMYILPN